jgi:type I restriction enzyme, S subunit
VSETEKHRRTIGELTTYIGSGATPRGGRQVYGRTGIPFIRSQNVREGRLDLAGVARIAPDIHAHMHRSAVRPNDVLLNITGASIGRSCVVPADLKEANVNQHVCIIRSNGYARPSFIQAMLELPRTQHRIRETAAGGSREGLNYQQVAALSIPWLPLHAQERLDQVRSRHDVVLSALRALITTKGELKRGLMRELLTGRRRFPAFGSAAGWTHTPFGRLPDDWRAQPLFEVAESVTRRNGDGTHRVLTCSGEFGLIDQTEFFTKSVASESREGYFLLHRGEFAYNRSTMTGYPFGAIKRLDRYDAGVLSTLNICFRICGDAWEPDFALHFFESGLLNRQLGRIARLGARAHGLLNVNKSDFFNLLVPVPSRAEQLRISSVLNSLDRELELLSRLQEGYDCQKRGLMQNLLSGELAVSDKDTDDPEQHVA